jgi:branched-chain amino acid aminotransferase
MSKHGPTGRTISYIEGEWHEGDVPVMSPFDDGAWLGQTVFDGARSFNGCVPDLDRHCERSIKSARILGMEPTITATEIETLCREGIVKFGPEEVLYICPLFFVGNSFMGTGGNVTKFVLSIREAAFPEVRGFSACLTRYRRPSRDSATTDAKASGLYPNVSRSVQAASEKGFDTAVMLDPNGNVAEFSYTNLFMVTDGRVHTPAINGTFLNGITRQRTIKLLRDDGYDVEERQIDFAELLEADELFSTSNYMKVMPCTKIEDRSLNAGPVYTRARELYFDWAKTQPV